MDNYDNFFNGINNSPERTPIYHTPDSSGGGPNKKMTTITVLLVIIAVIMCIAIVANVIVLASMKNQVAQNYADTLTQAVHDEYLKAIEDYLDGKEISDDVLAQIRDDVINALNNSAAAVAGTQTVYSTVRILASTSQSATSWVVGSGFIISAQDSNGTVSRYVVTNAHVVLNVVRTASSPWQTTYDFEPYSYIVCSFGDDISQSSYRLELVACGSYREVPDNATTPVNDDYLTQPDLAVLKFATDSPSESEHPSLNIATEEASYGESVAIVGFPENLGLSVTSGIVSMTAHKLSDWGAGEFYMTDTAINSGNSGGPMVNNKGEVIGVVESRLTSTSNSSSIQNIGYAVTSMTLIDFLAGAGLTPVTV